MTGTSTRRAVTAALLALPGALAWAQAPDDAVPDAPDAEWADAAITAPWTGDLDGMVERRAIRFLVVPSKTSFFLDRGQQLGITHDLAREFEAQLNKRLKLTTRKLVAYFIPTSRDRLLDDLLEGRGDIAAANLTITPERAARVGFSAPLFKNARELVCAHAGTTLPATPEDLAGREVMVRESSSYHASLRALSERLVADGRPPVTIVAAHPLLEDEDILEMVNAGIVELTVVDEHKAQLWVQIFPEVRMLEAVSLRDQGEIAWAMRPASPKLQEAVNAFVKTAAKGTKLGNMLLKKYLGTTKWIANAAAEQDRARFLQMVALFRRYADQYGFDYLMVGAQAYQESRLQQDLKSPVGAIGVMQVMPTTANDPNIAIPNIQELESNIHAGIKYLRFILDEYFPDANFDAFNRMMFAFASYNAGPNRIARLRKRAAEKGLDPDVWFNNVELIVAEKIGRETVQYVSNILKYYVIYNRIVTQTAAREAAKAAQPDPR